MVLLGMKSLCKENLEAACRGWLLRHKVDCSSWYWNNLMTLP